jgi:hypothetical protein
MKKILILTSLLALLFSCENSNDPEGTGNVTIVSSMKIDNITYKHKSNDVVLNESIDSIVVDEINVLISRIIFHEIDLPDDDEEYSFKNGPYKVHANLTNEYYEVVAASLPPEEFDRIKLEMHRFTPPESDTWRNDSEFGMFATDDRYSVIIKGRIYENDSYEEFTFNGQVTSNITLDLPYEIDLEDDEDVVIDIEFDPDMLFYDKGQLMDPRDNKISNKIENNIRSAFRSIILD